MNTTLFKLEEIVDKLQEIIEEAESRGVDIVRTCPNTYGLNKFVSLGYDGFLDLDCNVDDLFEEEED